MRRPVTGSTQAAINSIAVDDDGGRTHHARAGPSRGAPLRRRAAAPDVEGLKGMYAEIRHREVAELPPPEPAPDPEPHSSARSEAARPGAIVHKPSVLVPRARKRDAPLDEPTRDEVDRTCYLCFEFSGKPREECYMKEVGGEYTEGHHGMKEGSGIVCTWFDDEFNTGATEEATVERRKKAKNKRESALKKLMRRKESKLKKRAPPK